MQIEFTEPALIELDACPPQLVLLIYWRDAIQYYEIQSEGLGKRFFMEILETLELISKFPLSWSTNSEHTRKAVLRKFPFNLIYSKLNEKIYIIAVAHQNRLPEYWIDRI